MRVLTVRQPWAQLIVQGTKKLENRSWRPPGHLMHTRIAIHAGARWDPDAEALCEDLGIDVPQSLPAGLIGSVIVRDVVATPELLTARQRPWWRGPIAWVLADARRCDHLPCPGRLGLWRL